VKILVIGDTIMDTFVECNSTHLAQEAPIVCANVSKVKEYKGGAHAVRENCNALFGAPQVTFLTNVEILSRKRRYYTKDQLIFRVDEHHRNEMADKIQEDLEIELAKIVHSFDMVLIADYGKGTVTDQVLNLCNGAKQVILDPHPSQIPYHFTPTVYMPNRYEWALSVTNGWARPHALVIETRDTNGVNVHTGVTIRNYPTKNTHPRTVIGAGGAFMAAYAYSKLAHMDDISHNIKYALGFVAQAMKEPHRCVMEKF
jgi:bifunctional ADP-heptose synthase (sugar kinase/adenylyltransferase)